MTGNFGDARLPDRFWDKVEVVADASTYPGPCWIWTYALSNQGYGTYWHEGATRSAYSVCYKTLIGEFSKTLQLDHLCRVRSCCNPDHLEPVTGQVNTLRGKTVSGLNNLKTRCNNGHEFNLSNTRISRQGRRVCRVCPREARARLTGEALEAHMEYMRAANRKSKAKKVYTPEEYREMRKKNNEASRKYRERKSRERKMERE